MTKLHRLKQEARESAETRGHKLGRYVEKDGKSALVFCTNKDCVAYAQVKVNPLPNEIEIGGTALALHCPYNPE